MSTPTTPASSPSTVEVAVVERTGAASATAVVQPTQLRRPWRSTVRTTFQALVALCLMLPFLVEASGVDETLPPVAGALAIAGGISRVMALPQVEAFLRRFLPFLAAAPRQ